MYSFNWIHPFPHKTDDISSWAWTQYGQPAKAYAFTYDGAHRLTAGQFYNNGSSTNALSEKSISYWTCSGETPEKLHKGELIELIEKIHRS